MTTSHEWHLVPRPHGWPKAEDFALVEVELPEPGPRPGPGAQHLHVGRPVHARPDERREVLRPAVPARRADGRRRGRRGVAVVEAPRRTGCAVGDTVLHGLGWREHARCPPPGVRGSSTPPWLPASAYLGVLGMPGLTAYAGLPRIAEIQEGDAVFVSGAAGRRRLPGRPDRPAAWAPPGSSAPPARPRRSPG